MKEPLPHSRSRQQALADAQTAYNTLAAIPSEVQIQAPANWAG